MSMMYQEALPSNDAINGAYLGMRQEIPGSAQEAVTQAAATKLPTARAAGNAVLLWWIALFALLVASHVVTVKFQA